jgi:four helix bundle protein
VERLPARTFEDLLVWQKSRALALEIYKLSAGFPRAELWGLTSQLRRAAVSASANIAEGFKKRGQSDKARFLNIAQGSLEEVRCYLLLAEDLGYGHASEVMTRLDEVARLLASYTTAVLTRKP